MKEKEKRPIVLVSGGTGGHVIPAQILKSAFKNKDINVFFITDQRGEKYCKESVLFEGIILKMESGSFILRLFGVLKNVGKLLKLFLKLKPQAVIGFGGYPSAAGGIAAILLGIPLFLHEQNAVLGRVNRLFIYGARILFLTFPKTQKIPSSEQKKALYVGPLVRSEIENIGITNPYLEWDKSSKFYFLVLGGSQGSISLVEIVLKSLSQISENLKKKIFVILQAPSSVCEEAQNTLKELKIENEVAPFFHEMSYQLGRAHLVMARAGSGTVGEILASQRPCVFVPLPSAMDDHQTKNASFLKSIHGAWSFSQKELSSEALSELLQKFLDAPRLLMDASRILKNQYNSGAVERILGAVDAALKSLHKES